MATVESQLLPMSTFKGLVEPDWCPGCGDYGVLRALQTAVARLGINPKDMLVLSGIGCSSVFPHFFNAYGFHTIHGRALPVATGAKLANHDLHVIITGGDGDGYGIGAGHLVHTMRRNLDLTYIVMNNQIYGLTTGQTSATSEHGHKTKSTPRGNPEIPLNPIALGIVTGATFVARGFSGEQKQLARLMEQALQHKGFALIDVFSPCVTYNKQNTYAWFKERVYKLEDRGHDPADFQAAIARSQEWGAEIPIGLFYKTERPTYEEEEEAILSAGPLVKQKLGLTPEEGRALLEAFT